MGVALTGSRAGALELGLLALAAALATPLGTDSQRRVRAALAVWFVLVLLTIPSLARFLN
jgi:ABC-type proline/glycine betaine transport system permease subunit